MRPVDKENLPQGKKGQAIIFKKYARSRRYLIDIIGDYCSYCERKMVSGIEVEHILPQSSPSGKNLKLTWSNFLLSCKNCNTTKGTKTGSYFFPDRDNTYRVFFYDASGKVKVSPQLTDPKEIQRANNTIELAGLDKEPPKKYTVKWEEASDRRFEQRAEAFNEAQDYVNKYATASSEVRLIYLDCFKTIVIKGGFWSIWMRAFENFPEVQKALINSFNGTRCEFFQDILQ